MCGGAVPAGVIAQRRGTVTYADAVSDWTFQSSMSWDRVHQLTYRHDDHPGVFFVIETMRSRHTGHFARQEKYFVVAGSDEAFMCLGSALRFQQVQKDQRRLPSLRSEPAKFLSLPGSDEVKGAPNA